MFGNIIGSGWDDPKTAATLALAQQLLGGRGGGMQRLAAGLGGYQQAMGAAKREEDDRKRRALQDAMLTMQMQQALAQQAAAKKAQEQQAIDEELIRGQAQGLGPGGMGPAAPNPQFDPRAFMGGGGSLGGLQQLLGVQRALNPAEEAYTLAPGARRYQGGREVAANPVEQKLDAMIVTGPDGKPMVNPLWVQAKKATQAPGTVVNINEGQKGLENALTLRGKFTAEPIYKAHKEVESAYSQIVGALRQESPVGDMAAATKIMKILDPGSVVRESELGMAMAATGLLDRITNYAQMTLSGQKLTPQQRKDFRQLADQFLASSRGQYEATRSQYESLGQGYGMRTDLALPRDTGQVVAPGGVVDWSELPQGGR